MYLVNFSIKIFLVEVTAYLFLFSVLPVKCKLLVVCVLIANCLVSTKWLTWKFAQVSSFVDIFWVKHASPYTADSLFNISLGLHCSATKNLIADLCSILEKISRLAIL